MNMKSKPSLRQQVLSATVTLLIVAAAVASAQVKQQGIKNFGKVNDKYYRGAQPTPEDVEKLKSLGIKTIVDLRKDFEPGEKDWAKRAGLKYFNIPLKANRAATEEQTNYFLQLVNDPANWPVYVHCKGGRHRTGALTAVYRITHDGWTAEQAFKEMRDYDFDSGLFGGPAAQKRFVFSFYEQHKK
jgi:protein tyrosine/serine phosphatase